MARITMAEFDRLEEAQAERAEREKAHENYVDALLELEAATRFLKEATGEEPEWDTEWINLNIKQYATEWNIRIGG